MGFASGALPPSLLSRGGWRVFVFPAVPGSRTRSRRAVELCWRCCPSGSPELAAEGLRVLLSCRLVVVLGLGRLCGGLVQEPLGDPTPVWPLHVWWATRQPMLRDNREYLCGVQGPAPNWRVWDQPRVSLLSSGWCKGL